VHRHSAPWKQRAHAHLLGAARRPVKREGRLAPQLERKLLEQAAKQGVVRMTMRVDEAGYDEQPAGIERLRVGSARAASPPTAAIRSSWTRISATGGAVKLTSRIEDAGTSDEDRSPRHGVATHFDGAGAPGYRSEGSAGRGLRIRVHVTGEVFRRGGDQPCQQERIERRRGVIAEIFDEQPRIVCRGGSIVRRNLRELVSR